MPTSSARWSHTDLLKTQSPFCKFRCFIASHPRSHSCVRYVTVGTTSCMPSENMHKSSMLRCLSETGCNVMVVGIRNLFDWAGYSIWAFMFTCLPLALAGSLVFGLLYFISMGALRPLECCCGNNCLRTTEARLRALKDALLGATSDSCGSLMCVDTATWVYFYRCSSSGSLNRKIVACPVMHLPYVPLFHQKIDEQCVMTCAGTWPSFLCSLGGFSSAHSSLSVKDPKKELCRYSQLSSY